MGEKEMSETDKLKKQIRDQYEFEMRVANVESKYLTSQKKRYLLASNSDSVQQLIENQVNELTNILIAQKSEYDKLTRESKIKKEQTILLERKIKALEDIEEKTKKQQLDNQGTIETMENVLKLKDSRKKEENYIQSTLLKQIDKLKQDIILINKETYDLENENYYLSKHIEKAKFDSNRVLQNRNNVYSKIKEQEMKNKYEKNEQDLTIEYYETIIQQKYMFIKNADERKEKQKQIAEKAKNESNDKEEAEKRHQLQLLMLYNKYLRRKMKEQLKEYKRYEKVADKIRDICGSDDLNIMVDTLLNKNKRYNLACEKIVECEKKKKKLTKQLKKLNKKLEEKKTEVLIEIENTDNEKKLKPIEDKVSDKDKEELIKKENELNRRLFETGERANFVQLSYRKVIENINSLKHYQDTLPTKEDQNNLTTNITDENKNEEEGTEKKKEDNDAIEKIEEEKKEENEEKEKKEEINEEDGIIKLNVEEEKIIEDYQIFLKESLKTFEKLFLMHSKIEFLRMMKEKGEERKRENTKIRNAYAKSARVVRKVNHKKTRTILSSISRKKEEPKRRFSVKAKEIVIPKKIPDDDEITKYDEDKDIMKRFLEEQRNERANYLKVIKWTGKK